MRYGIRDGMLKQPLEGTFTKAKEIGFDGVEFCIGREYRDNPLWQDGGPERVKGMADEAGVAISSLSPGVFSSFHPALPEAERREEGVAILTHVISCCASMGTSEILVPMFPKDMDDWPESTWELLADGFKHLSAVAADAGVNLELETTFSAKQLDMLLNRVDSPAFKVYHDTGNTMTRGQDPAEEILLLRERIGMIHGKDTDRQHLGNGRVDFDSVDAAMREIGYDGWIVLETPVGDDDPDADNARNLEFIKKLGV